MWSISLFFFFSGAYLILLGSVCFYDNTTQFWDCSFLLNFESQSMSPPILFLIFYFIFEYSWLTMLFSGVQSNSVMHIHVLQRVRHDWVTELTDCYMYLFFFKVFSRLGCLEYWAELPVLYSEKAKVLVIQSCPTICNPMNRNLSGFPVHEIPQARILEIPTGIYWNPGISYSKGSFQARDWTHVFCISYCQADFLLLTLPRRDCQFLYILLLIP